MNKINVSEASIIRDSIITMIQAFIIFKDDALKLNSLLN